MVEIAILEEELTTGRKEIKTDSYNMSIGEIINLYKDGDIELDPAYQRLFRWDDHQKSRFIESILLGIPIPPIFVAQKAEGVWSIVDGVQRISTLLQMVGVLGGKEPLVLTDVKKLPSIEGHNWETLGTNIQRIIKRSKLGVNIILTENSIDSQYELFQRLNTGGSHLEPQEIRNCLIIMLSNEFYEKINALKVYDSYKDCLKLSEEKFKIEHHMELIVRYLIVRRNKINYEEYTPSTTLLSDFLDQEVKSLIGDEDFNLDQEVEIFKKVFDYFKVSLGKDVFKKYNPTKGKFEGPFLESSFEAIVPGVAQNIELVAGKTKEEFEQILANMYNEDEYQKWSDRGKKAITRIKGLTEFSMNYFSKI
jgi:uncharacterized protein with ParB-like and HNH nuclease domain